MIRKAQDAGLKARRYEGEEKQIPRFARDDSSEGWPRDDRFVVRAEEGGVGVGGGQEWRAMARTTSLYMT